MFPGLTAYYLSAPFYGDFPRQYDLRYGRPDFATPPAPPMAMLPQQDPRRARLMLTVPAVAEVWVEGVKMKATGATREFISPRLEEGRTYRYAVVVRWNEGNRTLERTMEVPVRAGETPALMVLAPLSGK